jgi:DNA primase small subunit
MADGTRTISRETEFIINWFRKHYERSPPPPPERFGRREFGFMFFDRDFVQRHVAFTRVNELASFLVSQVPAHVYYSSAYYEVPSAPTMEEKGWLGADLIFDLDADHIKGAESMSYPEMLSNVKKEIIRLLDEFLMGDLGFGSRDIKVVFSGGRGYHVHVSDDRVTSLRSHERREIVDFITGTGLDIDWLFPMGPFEKRQFKHVTKIGISRRFPSARSAAWRRRLRKGTEMLLDEITGLSIDAIKERYPSLKDASDHLIEKMLDDLFSKRGEIRGKENLFEKNTLEIFSSDKVRDLFLKFVFEEVKSRVAGQVDEPVTSDIKRLIRLPFTLHGKTGLLVVKMSRDELDEFDPLRDAVPDTFTDDPVKLITNRKIDIKLRGERFALEGEVEVPLFAAIFLLCRKEAKLAV